MPERTIKLGPPGNGCDDVANGEKHLKHILLKFDLSKPREKDIVELLERLKDNGISHKTAIMEALTEQGAESSSSSIEALFTKSEVIIQYVQELKQLVLQGVPVVASHPTRSTGLDTIGVSQEVILASETESF